MRAESGSSSTAVICTLGDVLLDEACDPLYEAVVECTEEAIVNALVAGETMKGPGGRTVEALSHEALKEVLKKYGR